jgi:hypothetical protein
MTLFPPVRFRFQPAWCLLEKIFIISQVATSQRAGQGLDGEYLSYHDETDRESVGIEFDHITRTRTCATALDVGSRITITLGSSSWQRQRFVWLQLPLSEIRFEFKQVKVGRMWLWRSSRLGCFSCLVVVASNVHGSYSRAAALADERVRPTEPWAGDDLHSYRSILFRGSSILPRVSFHITIMQSRSVASRLLQIPSLYKTVFVDQHDEPVSSRCLVPLSQYWKHVPSSVQLLFASQGPLVAE